MAKEEVALCGQVRFSMRKLLLRAAELNSDFLSLPDSTFANTASQYFQHFQNLKDALHLPAQLVGWIDAIGSQGVWGLFDSYRPRQQFVKMSSDERFCICMEILLEQLIHREATHRVDIVFAALSLLLKVFYNGNHTSTTPRLMRLDYNRHDIQTYRSITIRLLAVANNLNMLSLANNNGYAMVDKNTYEVLPSWVPDMTRPLSSSRLLARGFDASSSVFRTDGPETDASGHPEILCDSTTQLNITGIVLGSITALSPSSYNANIEAWVQAVTTPSPSIWSRTYSGATRLDVLARTLCASNEGVQSQMADAVERRTACTVYLMNLLVESYTKLYWIRTAENWNPDQRFESFWATHRHAVGFALESFPFLSKIKEVPTFLEMLRQLSIDDLAYHNPDQYEDWRCTVPSLPALSEAQARASHRLSSGSGYSTLVAPFAERRLFACSSGHVGLAPPGAQHGDIVTIMRGGSVPFIIRQVPGKEPWRATLVGDAYVDGLMHGEVKDLGLETRLIVLE